MTWDGSAELCGQITIKKCTHIHKTHAQKTNIHNHKYYPTAQMNALLPRIFPSVDFSEERERVRARLEHVLLTHLPETMFPRGSALRIFGSSGNGFGNDGADLNM